MKDKVNVLVVDDSPTVRQMLVNILTDTPMLRVVGEAQNGSEAVRMTRRLRPDVISMDIHMPIMNGFEATQEIMRTMPTPIVVVSGSFEHSETDIAFNAIKDGALAVLQKPPAPDHPDFGRCRDELVNTLAAMSDVAVIHIRPRRAPTSALSPPPDIKATQGPVDIIGIASSTGGPGALATILRKLPAEFPVPIVVVQHISPGFAEGLAHWLNGQSPLEVSIAQYNQKPEAGQVLIAPGGQHLCISRIGRVVFEEDRGEYFNVPSADVMLTSLAEGYGERAMGVVLTGMGSDGAFGLRAICDAGGNTIAQDETSSIVFGMPKEAIALGGARYVKPLERIASTIAALITEPREQRVVNRGY